MPWFARPPVVRERLLTRLGETLSPFTLVSAPPGFGKTTLVTQLAAARRDAVAWFQIDRLDSDPRRFVAHLLAAVQEEIAAFGQDHLHEVLQREVGADQRDIVRFVNAVSELDRRLILVLDDYHEIDNPAVHTLLAALLELQPPGLAVVMATRTEPPLPLGRFRARGMITEIGTQDLRFNDREALTFVREGLTLDLEEPLVTALNQRTEGWAAGLQLAGLSLRDGEDVAAFVAAFDGRERLVTDYLVQEVLEVQPPEIRQFLLATSVLERMNASLSAAVSGVADGQAVLQHLERQNMFLVALDRRREWYRYHHLFGDMLRRQLALQNPLLLATCHARASDWYAENDLVRESVEHALAIPDDERAAAMLEQSGWWMIQTMESRQISAWANRIAEPVLSRSLDRLAIALTAEVLIGNDINRRWLDRAEELVAGDDGTRQAYSNLLAWVRSGSLARERRYTEAALALSTIVDRPDPSGMVLQRILPPLGHATAAYWKRDLELAARLFQHAISVSLDAGAGAMFFPSVLNLFEVLRVRGDAQAAADVLQRARTQAQQSGWINTLGRGWLWFAEGEQAYAANDLDAAESACRQAIDLTRFAGSNTIPLLAAMRLAMIAHLRGDRAGAIVLSNEIAGTTHRPNASFVAGLYDRMLTHMWLVLGNAEEAGKIFAALELARDDEFDAAREEDYIELARWHIARRGGSTILRMLARMLIDAETGGRTRSVVELQILQALARQQTGDLRQACVSLEAALRTAVGLRDHRVFLDAGGNIAALLRRVRQQPGLPADVQLLVDTLRDDPGMSAAARDPHAPHRAAEPLSRQELQVLRMLGAGYSNEEISKALFISGNTVKTHLRHIYAKLDVKTRTAAVSRAAALHLLEF
ncbi:MAG TPA: LuxR C-terminal-related transcriptional regulator [Blastocatellia bacterium]|nr:LuxR C-terminal-related transcriptional regulator [Blastocatellia bacterium]